MNAMNDEWCQMNEEWENEWMNYWMNEWDEMKNGLNFPHEKFQVILVDFIDFSLERNKPKVKRTDAVTLSQLQTKQGRIHGYPSRVRVGRGSDR